MESKVTVIRKTGIFNLYLVFSGRQCYKYKMENGWVTQSKHKLKSGKRFSLHEYSEERFTSENDIPTMTSWTLHKNTLNDFDDFLLWYFLSLGLLYSKIAADTKKKEGGWNGNSLRAIEVFLFFPKESQYLKGSHSQFVSIGLYICMYWWYAGLLKGNK